MYGDLDGFPLIVLHCLGWYCNIMSPVKHNVFEDHFLLGRVNRADLTMLYIPRCFLKVVPSYSCKLYACTDALFLLVGSNPTIRGR